MNAYTKIRAALKNRATAEETLIALATLAELELTERVFWKPMQRDNMRLNRLCGAFSAFFQETRRDMHRKQGHSPEESQRRVNRDLSDLVIPIEERVEQEWRQLYTIPPPAPVSEIREVVYATAEMSSRVANSYFGIDTPANMSDMLEVLRYWRRELGPTLGLVELREPTDDECRRICFAEMKLHPMQSWPAIRGRAMFDAVRAVMFPQKSEVPK